VDIEVQIRAARLRAVFERLPVTLAITTVNSAAAAFVLAASGTGRMAWAWLALLAGLTVLLLIPEALEQQPGHLARHPRRLDPPAAPEQVAHPVLQPAEHEVPRHCEVQVGPQLFECGVGFSEQLLIGLEAVELHGGLGIGHGRLPFAELFQLGLHLIELAHLLLRLLLVVPEVGLGGQLFEILLARFQSRDVKDSPGHRPGGQ
jgi:hypothetical protein